ncbi:LacI family DNA-binding transcriptional regulator [uncultured Anaerotruncus sp.]|uniref:LacI family DNA-binding transcriptional regulator n=1 Tax=uncultured Anaerotruncus sp. TaxID=905011 RepID=UPI00280B6430|nr:LacI family DNA-binding transcriptional regulator [uncultured Anaerotruncus sp.]
MGSIREIADLTGLSVATVSHVINGTRKVSQASTDLVMKAIEETGYKPNYAARMLRTQRSNTIAMLIPRVEQGMSTNIFFMDVLSGAKDYFQSIGYSMIVATYSENDEDDEQDMRDLQVLKKQWMDGVLVVPNKKKYAHLMKIIESSLPFVLLDRSVTELDCSCVYSDSTKVSREAVELFFRGGKRRIGYIGGSTSFFTGYDRFSGYREGLESCGLPLDDALVVTSGKHTVQAGYLGAQKLVKNGADAIYISNDVQTVGALEFLQSQQLRIPNDVGIIAFEDYEWMTITSPPLTTVRQQPYKMGWLGAQLLHRKLGDPAFNEKIRLDAELVLRDSHGAGKL